MNVWGWRAIPNETRLPFTVGISGLRGNVSKATGLTFWLVTGLIPFWGAMAARDREPLWAWVGAGLLAFYVTVQYATVKRLSR